MGSETMGSSYLDRRLYKRKKRLKNAVRQNNVELLKDLLDSPKWYNITDKEGFNLLQSAIVNNKKEVFDYLLSLPDYPLEFENKEGTTTLELAVYSMRDNEYFACELIKKGACIEKICCKCCTLLHYACEGGFVKTSMLLIEKGIDVNVRNSNGHTPLQMICNYYDCDLELDEVIFMLLEFGADPSIRDYDGYTPFENSVKYDHSNEVQEALFYYTFDKFSLLQIHLDILLILAERNSPLFYEITKQKFEIIVETNESNNVKCCFKNLCLISPTNLRLLITKFDTSFKILFAQLSEVDFHNQIAELSIEKLNILIESSLKYEFINIYIPFICTFLPGKINYSKDKSELTEYICFLLSYGLEIHEEKLYLIYKKFGYCDLFKILLHMDIRKKNFSYSSYILPKLLINITENLEDVFKSMNIHFNGLRELTSYFVHPKLRSIYRKLISKNSNKLPQIPSLLELSRNVFRSYFINKFQIKTSRKFYTLLNCLEISPDYKKILTYETKLYSI